LGKTSATKIKFIRQAKITNLGTQTIPDTIDLSPIVDTSFTKDFDKPMTKQEAIRVMPRAGELPGDNKELIDHET
jgi:hypothetical protein